VKRLLTVGIVVCILLSVLFTIPVIPLCSGEKKTNSINLSMQIEIISLDLENHTVVAKVSLTIENFPENATKVYAMLDDINHDTVDCIITGGLVNGIYRFQNESSTETSWYINYFGQLYPFDIGYVNFRLYPSLEYEINNTRYGLSQPISFNVLDEQVVYSGMADSSLVNTWQIEPINNGGEVTVNFVRYESVSQILVIVPLIWFLTLVAAVPLFTKNKKTKIQFYSSMLVFAPIFIFAIQSYIPTRSSLSFAEFLGLTLILSSASMFLFSLPKQRTEKNTCYFEVAGLALSWVFSYFMGLFLFFPFLLYLPIQVFFIILSSLYALMMILRIANYLKYEKKLYEPNIDY
jgi:hypothetical protein